MYGTITKIDKKKGDKTGDGIGGVWHIVSE